MNESQAHGDEGTIDIEPFLDSALSDVIETIMLFGEYPQPRTGNYANLPAWLQPRPRPVQFRLWEFIVQTFSTDELREIGLRSLIDHSIDFDQYRLDEASRVARLLKDHLRGSAIVQDRAEELAREAKEE